jgi:lysophospholipase L1-like esterase
MCGVLRGCSPRLVCLAELSVLLPTGGAFHIDHSDEAHPVKTLAQIGALHLTDAKRPILIAAAAVLGLGIGFYLHGVVASHGFSTRALIGRMIGLEPESPAPPPANRVLAEVYAALPRHATVVMLGDSITEWTDWNALLPSFDVANRGISGDTTEGVLERIDSIIAMHPRCVAVMLGVNDLFAKRSVQQVLQNYTTIIDRLSASGSTVIVQSTLITSNPSLNALVIDVDRSLAEMCRQSGRCLYVDLNSTVASTGAIADSIDGIHLGPNSYKTWASTLTPFLNPNCR